MRAVLHSGSSPERVYNPFFDPNLLPPARLVVFDAQKQYVTDVLPFRREVEELPPYSAWFDMNGAHRFGRRLGVRILNADPQKAAVPNRPESELAIVLTPGQYYLQLVYTNRLLSGRTSPVAPNALRHWMAPCHDNERLRSNVVEIAIVERALREQGQAAQNADTTGNRAQRRAETEERTREAVAGRCDSGIEDLPSVADLSSHLSPPLRNYRLSEQTNLNCGKYRGRSTISVPRRRLVSGDDSLALQITFENTSDVGYQVNSPTSVSESILFRPAVLAIFDQDKKCIGDLFETSWLHGGNPSPSAWKYLPAGAICGTGWSRKAGYVFPEHDSWNTRLAPGKYYIQLVYLERFIAPPPQNDMQAPAPDSGPEAPEEYEERLRKSMMQWPVKYGRPLFRSNIVEIELLDKPDAPPIATTNGLPIR